MALNILTSCTLNRLPESSSRVETLAAALLTLTPWNKDRILVDPFCGSGTIPIEAALKGLKIAPGVNRHFQAESFRERIPEKYWDEAREEAKSQELHDVKLQIQGFDIDRDAIKIARQNAEMAGVADQIHFQVRPMQELSHPKKYGFIVTNPPYGERLEEKEALPGLYIHSSLSVVSSGFFRPFFTE